MIFLAGVMLTALAAIFVLMPLFREPKGNLEVELLAETELDRLLNRKAVIYSNLKDLEFEFKMGRLAGQSDLTAFLNPNAIIIGKDFKHAFPDDSLPL